MHFGQPKRREFITLLGGAVALPLAARAQPKMRRIGVLILGNADAQSFGAELRAGLRESGYFEGQNIEFVFRSADNDASSLPALAAELAALKVDVLVALYTPCALAAQKATRQISNCHRIRRSSWAGAGHELGSTGWEHHGHISDGGGATRQMRRAVS